MKSSALKGHTMIGLRLGYKEMHIEKGSSSMTIEKEVEQKSYAEVIRGSHQEGRMQAFKRELSWKLRELKKNITEE
jgi:hypothetical protein